MKNFFAMTVLIMITTVGFSYEYSHESVRYFSDKEITNLLPNIAKVNPHILNLNLIYPGEVLNIPIDGTFVSVYIKEGDNVFKILSFDGISERQIFEAKFLKPSIETKTDIITGAGLNKRLPIPIYIWWNIAGVCFIFIGLVYVYKRLKKFSK